MLYSPTNYIVPINQEADEIHKRLVKKYSLEKEVWIKAALFNYRTSHFDQARKLLERACISLPKSERKFSFFIY